MKAEKPKHKDFTIGLVIDNLLARIQGARPGVKGIPFFAVPKLLPDGRGSLAVFSAWADYWTASSPAVILFYSGK